MSNLRGMSRLNYLLDELNDSLAYTSAALGELIEDKATGIPALELLDAMENMAVAVANVKGKLFTTKTEEDDAR